MNSFTRFAGFSRDTVAAHGLMPRLGSVLSLSQVDTLGPQKFISLLKLKPINLDALLNQLLDDSIKNIFIIKGLGVKFWCSWCQDTLGHEKRKRIAILKAKLPEDMRAQKTFQTLSSNKKKASGAQVKTAKRHKKTGDEVDTRLSAVAGPDISDHDRAPAEAYAPPLPDDESFNVEDAVALLINLSTEFRLKKSPTGNRDVMLAQKRMLAVGLTSEPFLAEDIALFEPYPEVAPAFVNFLFQYKKKFEAFRELFILQDDRSTSYINLIANGFTLTQIIQVLGNAGGFKNLKALQSLILKAEDRDEMPLEQLKETGFEPIDIIRILVYGGGAKNLKALQALTVTTEDQDKTPLEQLQTTGFEPADIIHILANIGGSKNLKALQSLTVKAEDQDKTPLEQLKEAGFESNDIIRILAHGGGSKNLKALQALTIKAEDQDKTPLQQLQAAGFEPSYIVSILAHNGGSKNLKALQDLTVKAEDQDKTPLQQLQAAKFEPSYIAKVLSNDGGSKNLEALLNFMPHYSSLTHQEETCFLSFASLQGASTRVKLAQRLIEIHGEEFDKARLFDFLKGETNKSAALFEALPLRQLVKKITSKKAKKVSAAKPKPQVSIAEYPAHSYAVGAFGGLAGIPGYDPDLIPKVDGVVEPRAAQMAEV